MYNKSQLYRLNLYNNINEIIVNEKHVPVVGIFVGDTMYEYITNQIIYPSFFEKNFGKLYYDCVSMIDDNDESLLVIKSLTDEERREYLNKLQNLKFKNFEKANNEDFGIGAIMVRKMRNRGLK